MEQKEYEKWVTARAARSPVLKNCLAAFLVGGAICALGEVLFLLYSYFGVSEKVSAMLVTVSLIFLSALLTGLGVFDNIVGYSRKLCNLDTVTTIGAATDNFS